MQPSKFIELINDFFIDFERSAAAFQAASGSDESKQAARQLAELAKQFGSSIENDDALLAQEQTQIASNFDNVSTALQAMADGTTANLRLASINCSWTDWECLHQEAKNAYDNYLKAIAARFANLNLTPSEGGFIPKLLYINKGSIAFECGMIDGAYKAVVSTGKSLSSMSDLLSCMNVPAVFTPTCIGDLKSMWDGVQGVAAFIVSDGAASKVWSGVKKEMLTFVDNNVGLEPINRYHNGRTVFEVATMFVGVGTVVAGLKVMKAAKLAQAITEVAKVADKLDVTSKILSKAGVSLKKIGPKAGKFVIRNTSGNIVGTAFEVVNGVYKNVKLKTSNSYNQLLGTIEGSFEFTNGKKHNGQYDIWGSCPTLQNAKINGATSEASIQCETVTDVAVAVAKRVARKINREVGELNFGRHRIKQTNGLSDILQSHHTPSKKWWQENKALWDELGLSPSNLNDGLNLPAIGIEKKNIHYKTHTFGSSIKESYKNKSPDSALKEDIEDLIKLYKLDNLDVLDPFVKKQLENYVNFIYNDEKLKKIFKNKPTINWNVK